MYMNYKDEPVELMGSWLTQIFDVGKGLYNNFWDKDLSIKKNEIINSKMEEYLKEKESQGFDFKKYLPIIGIGAAALLLLRKK